MFNASKVLLFGFNKYGTRLNIALGNVGALGALKLGCFLADAENN